MKKVLIALLLLVAINVYADAIPRDEQIPPQEWHQ